MENRIASLFIDKFDCKFFYLKRQINFICWLENIGIIILLGNMERWACF